MMRKTLLAAATALALVSTAAIAETTIVTVPITSVTPNYITSEVRTPVNSCTQQLVPVTRSGQVINNGGFNAGTLIGGIFGGILGNQVGGGDGKTIATATGSVLGAHVLGNQNQNSTTTTTTQYENRTVCTTSYRIDHKQHISGYVVTYNFDGRSYNTVMTFAPRGDTLNLRVNKSHTITN